MGLAMEQLEEKEKERKPAKDCPTNEHTDYLTVSNQYRP